MPQLDLIPVLPDQVTYAIPNAEVSLQRFWIPRDEADQLLESLLAVIPWRQDKIRMFGRVHDVPRLQQWFADGGLRYTWSGIAMDPAPWLPALEAIRERLLRSTGVRFNTALANLYRDGADTVGWHADDEPELGEEPLIASVSLGAARDFVLRHRSNDALAPLTIELTHGSLLLMGGATQRCWSHCVPRRRRVKQPRINLTFRAVRASSAAELFDGPPRYARS